jgi:hypothetical protein
MPRWRKFGIGILWLSLLLLLLMGLGPRVWQWLRPGAIRRDVEQALVAKLRKLDQSDEITKKYGRFLHLSDARMIRIYPGFTPFESFDFEATAHFEKGHARVHCDLFKAESVTIVS